MITTKFHKNVPGDFYTNGECLACGLPETEAPEFFAPLTNGNYDTYFIRQPVTSEVVMKVCKAAKVCCVDAIRYCGKDLETHVTIGERHCDPLPADSEQSE